MEQSPTFFDPTLFLLFGFTFYQEYTVDIPVKEACENSIGLELDEAVSNAIQNGIDVQKTKEGNSLLIKREAMRVCFCTLKVQDKVVVSNIYDCT